MENNMWHATWKGGMLRNKGHADLARTTAFWQIAYKCSFVLSGTLCVITAVFDTFFHTLGRDLTLILTITAVIATTYIGPKFLGYWASGVLQVMWAGLLTAFLASGTALCVTQIADVMISGTSVTSLASLPVTFASAAFLVPISLYAYPITFLVWGGCSVITAYCARKIVALTRLEQSLSTGNEDHRDNPSA